MTTRTIDREKAKNFDQLSMPCKWCSGTVDITGVTANFNAGDSIISPHQHLNLFYDCSKCGNSFVVRADFSPSDLYYGDVYKGKPVDNQDRLGRVTDSGVRVATWGACNLWRLWGSRPAPPFFHALSGWESEIVNV